MKILIGLKILKIKSLTGHFHLMMQKMYLEGVILGKGDLKI